MAALTPKTLPSRFYKTTSGTQPVRDFLMELSVDDRRTVSIAIAKIEWGWPIGMPICKFLRDQMWEVRVTISNNRLVRVIFTPYEEEAVLLHAFFKQTRKTEKRDLDIATSRRRSLCKEGV